MPRILPTDGTIALTFDDVLIQPAHSTISPTEANTKTNVTRTIGLDIPILASAMDTVTESNMAIALAKAGGMGVIHKNLSEEDQASEVRKVKEAKESYIVGAAIGAGEKGLTRARKLIDAGVDVLVVDTAHGHAQAVIDSVKATKALDNCPQIIAGNIATAAAAKMLIEAGADAVKVGIGPGSICTTRVMAGIGVPQLTAIMNVAEATKGTDVALIADGGIKTSGDIAKAIAAGADCVMVGSMLAGTDEAPGELLERGGKKYKDYRGMGSLPAMKAGSKDRYFQQEQDDDKKLVPEGIEGRVLYKGAAKNVIHQMVGGLKASMGYTGNADIASMQENCTFVRISSAGLIESHPHSITVVADAPNYTSES